MGFGELILCFRTSSGSTGNASLVGQVTIQSDSEVITEIAIYPKEKSKVLSMKHEGRNAKNFKSSFKSKIR